MSLIVDLSKLLRNRPARQMMGCIPRPVWEWLEVSHQTQMCGTPENTEYRFVGYGVFERLNFCTTQLT